MTLPRLARLLRCIADRLDHRGAPKSIGWSFTFERGRGMVFHEGRQQGCPLWYLGDDDYERAHIEGDDPPPRVDWQTATVHPPRTRLHAPR